MPEELIRGGIIGATFIGALLCFFGITYSTRSIRKMIVACAAIFALSSLIIMVVVAWGTR